MPIVAAIYRAASLPIAISWASLISTICGRPVTGLVAQAASSARASSAAHAPRQPAGQGSGIGGAPGSTAGAQRRGPALQALEDTQRLERGVPPARRDAVGAVAGDVVLGVMLRRNGDTQALEPARQPRRRGLVCPLMERVGQVDEAGEREREARGEDLGRTRGRLREPEPAALERQ